ncbi:MAG: DNA repair protein RecN, partial [Propionibacterium sp.]
MLTELHIQQLGVITESRLEPAPGLTAVTGETGAGKTMIVTGLGLLLGHRADPTMVRTGAEQARVEGVFTGLDDVATRLSELGAETDAGELIVARQLRTNGRSRAWLGGVAAPLGTVAGVVGELATIHGQLEQVRLGTEERQRQVLDRFGGKPVAEVLERYRELFELRRSVDKELNERVENSRERAREADLLAFGLSEIERVDPQPGEDTELATRAQRLQAMDDLRMLAQEASHALSGADDGDPDDPGVVGLAGIAVKNTGRIAEMDPQAEALGEQLNQLGLAAQEAAGALASYVAGLDADPLALETITTRRAELADLTRKYGENIDAVLDWARDASERIEDLGSDEQRIEALRTRRTQLDEQLHHQAEVLHGLRVKAAQHLASGVREELGALAMP